MNIQILIRPNLVRKGLATVIAIALLISFTACVTTEETDTSTITQEQSTAVPTAVISSTLSATELLAPTKSTITNDACWPMQNIGHRSLSGSLLYYYLVMDPATGAPTAGAPAVFNLETGQSKGLKYFLPRDISPDGKMLTDLTESSWVFLTESQNLSYPIPDVTSRKDSTYMFLPNGQMLWEGSSLSEKNNPSDGATRDMYVFSPGTGKLTFLQSVFLPYNLSDPLALHDKYRVALFSPDLKYVLYPANYKGTNLSILLNVESQKIIWYGWPESDLGFYNRLDIPTPIWRTDSSGIILYKKDDKTGIQNFYNLSIDGQVSQLTHLDGFSPSSKYILSSPAISPDGRYLTFAFVRDIQIFPGRISLLLILDLKTGTIINPCIPLANHPYPDYPIWSPDSSAIIVFPDAGNALVAVDLKEKNIFYVASTTGLDAGSLLGWLGWEIP